jgi:hypothetical protein
MAATNSLFDNFVVNSYPELQAGHPGSPWIYGEIFFRFKSGLSAWSGLCGDRSGFAWERTQVHCHQMRQTCDGSSSLPREQRLRKLS